MLCSLCRSETRSFRKSKSKEYVECVNCRSIQLLPQFFASSNAEKERYLTHNNDIEDPRYQKFVSPITSNILRDFTTEKTGLDYGCGTGPVAAAELEKQGYDVALYDPYFYNNKPVLEENYDFIICCEVMEHFYEPRTEFARLASLLNPGGKLYCKTSVYSEEIDFDNWYYKNDPTHVFFYTKESLEWIKNNLGYSTLRVEPQVIIFSK